MTTASTACRTEQGRFAPGVSGNPKGRPKGSRNLTTLLTEAVGEGAVAAVIRAALAAALAGDRPLLRFFATRLAPPAQRLVELDLPEGWAGDPRTFLTTALRAVAEARLAPEEAARLARVVELGEQLPEQAAPVSDLYKEPPTARVAPATKRPAAAAPSAPPPARGEAGRPAAASGAPPAQLPDWLGPREPAARRHLFSSCSALGLAA